LKFLPLLLFPALAVFLWNVSKTATEKLVGQGLPSGGRGPAAVTGSITGISTTGAVELAWDWEVYHDPQAKQLTYTKSGTMPTNTLDGPARFFRNASGGLFVLAPMGVNYRIPLNSDFRPQRALNAGDRIFDSTITTAAANGQYYHVGYGQNWLSGSCVQADYDNLYWVYGLWSADGTNFSALTHHEFYPGVCPENTTAPWIAAVGHMTSNNGGASFLPSAYTPYGSGGKSNASRLVLVPRPYQAGDPQKITYGFYEPSNIVKEGSYYYALVMTQMWNGQIDSTGAALVNGGFSMIRTTNVGRSTGWQIYADGWQPLDPNSYIGANFQPTLFHQQSSYSPYTTYPAGGQSLGMSLVQHQGTGQWIAVGYSNQGATTVQFTLTNSLASPNWGPIRPISGAPAMPTGAYPAIMSPNSPGYVFQYVDDAPYLYFVSPNNSSYVPSGAGRSVSSIVSRSYWRIKLAISTGSGTSTGSGGAIPVGLFMVGSGIYYSNGGAYCQFGSMAAFTASTGKIDTNGIPVYGSIPANMKGNGTCASPAPAPAASPVIPAGLFMVGGGIYYSNGGSYCRFGSMAAFTASTGKTDASGITSYASIPASMRSNGTCVSPAPAPAASAAIPSGLFMVGSGIYYSNGGSYCKFGSMASFTASTGKKDASGITSYPSLPTGMGNGGICGP
jgi:hypothetical protein